METTHTETAKKEQMLKIAHGIITDVDVIFPPGCHSLVHSIIRHHEHQIFPSTEGMSLVGDGFPIKWTEYYESYQPPYELKIEAWEESCTYDHTVLVKVAILPRKAVVALAIVDSIKDLFGTIGEFFGMMFPKSIPVEEEEG